LNINYSTAKTILRIFRKEKRIDKINADGNENSIHARNKAVKIQNQSFVPAKTNSPNEIRTRANSSKPKLTLAYTRTSSNASIEVEQTKEESIDDKQLIELLKSVQDMSNQVSILKNQVDNDHMLIGLLLNFTVIMGKFDVQRQEIMNLKTNNTEAKSPSKLEEFFSYNITRDLSYTL
jgi:hypothetical protein